MIGPKALGHWSGSSKADAGVLVCGTTYRVVKPFQDFDEGFHAAGEMWRFLGSSFLPYDDGLSLFVADDRGEWQIRLCLRPEDQGVLWKRFADYVEAVSP